MNPTSPSPSTKELSPEERERAYWEQIERDLPRNFLANLAHGMLGQTGFRLMSAPTFVPAYIYLLTASKVAVGLVLGAQFIGMAMSSIWSATLIEHRERVMRVVYAVGWLMRIQIFLLAVSAFLVDGHWALLSACVFLTLYGFFSGMQGVAFGLLMSKVIPINQRGRLFGWRDFLGGLTASGVAYLGGEYLVGLNAFGNGYASTFMLAFILTSIGISALTFVREPVSLATRPKSSGFIERMADIPGILRSDRDYRKFFYAAGLGALGSAAVPFYILYVGDHIHLSGAALGYFSLAFLLTLTICNLVWGKIADTKGYRLVFILSVGLWGLSTVMLIAGSSFMVFMVAFCGLGAGFGGYQMASQNFVLEFGRPHELPMLIAVSNTASYLMMAVGPFVGGIIATHFGYQQIFWLALAVKIMSVLMIWKIKDPRNRSSLRIDVE